MQTRQMIKEAVAEDKTVRKRTGRVVAVTGGTRGVGLAIAQLFASRGDHVAVCSRSAHEASLPEEMLHVSADVRGREAQRRFVETVVGRFGRLEVFVNCAGVYGWRALGDIDEAFAQDVVSTSALGTLWGCAAAAKAMRAGGSIINVSSLAGKRGSANNSAYCAAKFAVNGITQALAKELGCRGIRVNAVCPGYVDTPQIMHALAGPASPAKGMRPDAYLASFVATQTALGRIATPQEIAEVVYFLASPAASAITGQCLNVDCGTFPQ